jgi:polyhydroxybutyrate depolymerase
MINGVDDPMVPWDGGSVRVGRRSLGTVLATEDTIGRWAGSNGCSPAPQISWVPDRNAGDGSRVRMSVFQACAAGGETVLYAIEGGGHTWPGGQDRAPFWRRWLVGNTNQDLDATAVIWDFFRRQRRG